MGKRAWQDGSEYEVATFCRYLLHQPPSQDVQQRYAHIVTRSIAAGTLESISSNKTLQYALTHPWSIGLLDAASAIKNKPSQLRQRLFLLFAILEATPNFSNDFLAKKVGWWYVVVIGLAGARAVIRAACGSVLAKMKGLNI